MRRKIRCVLVLFFFYSPVVKCEIGRNGRLEFVQKGIEEHSRKIRTMYIQYEVYLGTYEMVKQEGRWWMKGDKKALEVETFTKKEPGSKNYDFHNKSKATFVNGVGKSFSKQVTETQKPPQGVIASGEPADFFTYTPYRFFMTIYWRDIVQVINNGTAQVLGREEIDKHDCFVVSGTIKNKGKYRLWVDYHRDFRPLKIETINEKNDPGSMFSIENIQLKETHGFWYPVYAELIACQPGLKKEPLRIAMIKITKVEINKEIDDTIFDLEFPANTVITNTLKKSQ